MKLYPRPHVYYNNVIELINTWMSNKGTQPKKKTYFYCSRRNNYFRNLPRFWDFEFFL